MRSKSANVRNANDNEACRKKGSESEKGVRIKQSTIHGTGLFSTKKYLPGECIIEYAGKVRRWSDCEDERTSYTCLMGIERNLVIDPRIQGNIARFINHCCSPNCEAVLDGKKVFIQAAKRIHKDDELTIDYSLIIPLSDQTLATHYKYTCRCGSPKCRSTMLQVKKKKPTSGCISKAQKARQK